MKGSKKKEIERSASGSVVERASSYYGDLYLIRAALQAVPYLGGSLDTLLAGAGTNFRSARIEDFVKKLDERLRAIENAPTPGKEWQSEEAFDFFTLVIDGVARSRSKEKRDRFASLVSNCFRDQRSWDESETAARVLRDLSDLHVEILWRVLNSSVCLAPFEGLRILSLREDRPKQDRGIRVFEEFRGVPKQALRLACSELVARGLLLDEGVGRMDTGAMEYLAPTAETEWLFEILK